MTERTDLLQSLRRHRGFLLQTVEGLDDTAARRRSTVSELTLASLLKHVADTEHGWAQFVVDGPAALGGDVDVSSFDPATFVDDRFVLTDDDTLDALRERYSAVAAETDQLVTSVDLDAEQPLPRAPWFEPGASWSARRVVLHIIAETAQHAGHADIIREAIDGAKTMG
ncbi:MAG TPA: DinB family protein [Mycobacteriales bacterium]|nr:DinB family protein [Mycobacteriales bacterium]